MLLLMIYQDFIIVVLFGYVVQYYSEIEIVLVSIGGEKECSCWGEVVSCVQWLVLVLVLLGLLLGVCCVMLVWNNCCYLEIYFVVFFGGWVMYIVNLWLLVDYLWYIFNDVVDEVLFFDQIFLLLVVQLLLQLLMVKYVVLMEFCSEVVFSQLFLLLFYDDLLQQGMVDYCWLQFNELILVLFCYILGIIGWLKGVLNIYCLLVLYVLSGNQLDVVGILVKDSLLLVVLMFYVNVWGMLFIVVMVGVWLVLLGLYFDGDSLLQLLVVEKVMVGFGVLVIWVGLLVVMCWIEVWLFEFKCVLVGGFVLLLLMVEVFQCDYGIVLIYVWGMIEILFIGIINILLSKYDVFLVQEQ